MRNVLSGPGQPDQLLPSQAHVPRGQRTGSGAPHRESHLQTGMHIPGHDQAGRAMTRDTNLSQVCESSTHWRRAASVTWYLTSRSVCSRPQEMTPASGSRIPSWQFSNSMLGPSSASQVVGRRPGRPRDGGRAACHAAAAWGLLGCRASRCPLAFPFKHRHSQAWSPLALRR